MLERLGHTWIGYDVRPRAAHVWDAWERDVRVDDKLLSAVVFIGNDRGGSFTAFGTGFLATAATDGRLFQHIVTARHVIEDYPQDRYCIRINTRGGMVEHTYADKGSWVFHPNPNIDLATCPSHVPPEAYDIKHIYVERELATPEVIQEHDIGVGEDIFTAGMFTRVLGETLNRPIVRSGTIAAMPAEPIETTRGSFPAYLVEARSIAGLSGSPVFVHMAPVRILPGGEVSLTTGKTHYFLGVMQGHFQTSDATDIVPLDEEFVPGDMNAGIGVVIPGHHVLELMNMPSFKNEREKIVADLKRNTGFVADSAAAASKAENQDHKEDFTRLLNAAARKREPKD